MRHVRKGAAALAACFLALSGCALLPQSGEVHAVDGSDDSHAVLGLTAQPPVEGASPEDIVSGFVAACQTGFDDDFAVARQYLTPDASREWSPMGQVRIYPDMQSVNLSRTPSGAVHATVGSAGSVARTGVFTTAPESSMISTDFSLARNADGEWRIVVLEDGVFLSEQSFSELYVETPVYFLSPDSSSLVADLRFFPKKNFASDAVRALLAGPSEWLATGVRTAVPVDTVLAKEGVAVEGGVATVHLSRAVLSATDEDLSAMYTQIQATLTTSATIDSVVLAAEETPLEASARADLAPYPYGSYPLVALQSGVPAVIREQRGTPLMDPAALGGRELTDLAAAYESVPANLAALADNGRELVRLRPETDEVATIATGTALVPPSFDSHGWIWSGEEANGGRIVAYHLDGLRTSVIDVPWLAGSRLKSLRISREGTRIVAVVEHGEGSSIVAAAISRDESFAPTSVGESTTVSQSFSSVEDIAWMSQTQLVVLGKAIGDADIAVHSVQVGGLSSQLVAPQEGTVDLSAGRGQQTVVTVTGSGSVFGLNGGAWNRVAEDATSVAFPG